MAKLMTDGMIDGGLTKMGTCTRITVCAGQPTSYADIDVRKLAQTTLAGGDFTIANGDTSGRKSTVAQKAGVSITVSGTADHVVIDDGVSQYTVTTATSQALTSGGTITISSFKLEIADPT